MRTIFINNMFVNIKIWEINNSEMLEQIWKRQAPNNDEDPLKNPENLEYGTNIFQKHEMEVR